MRGSREASRRRSTGSGRTQVGLVLTALLGLWLTQPLHGPSPASAAGRGTTKITRATGAPDSPQTRHDADTCQLCRAASQTRTTVCAATLTDVAVPGGRGTQLQAATAALPQIDPVRCTWPRAPPRGRFVLDG